MNKWIWALVLLAICGCAGQRTRITLTRIDGEPSISIEFQDTKEKTGRSCQN